MAGAARCQAVSARGPGCLQVCGDAVTRGNHHADELNGLRGLIYSPALVAEDRGAGQQGQLRPAGDFLIGLVRDGIADTACSRVTSWPV